MGVQCFWYDLVYTSASTSLMRRNQIAAGKHEKRMMRWQMTSVQKKKKMAHDMVSPNCSKISQRELIGFKQPISKCFFC